MMPVWTPCARTGAAARVIAISTPALVSQCLYVMVGSLSSGAGTHDAFARPTTVRDEIAGGVPGTRARWRAWYQPAASRGQGRGPGDEEYQARDQRADAAGTNGRRGFK